MIPELQFTRLEKEMWAYGYEVQARYRAALTAKRINASSKLYKTAQPIVKQTGSIYTLYMRMEDYWKYVEYGTRELAGRPKGKFPPLSPFVSWVRQKGIPLNGKKLTSVAYAIATKIGRGIPSKGILSGTIPKNVLREATLDKDEATMRLEAAAGQDIQDWLTELMESINRE